MRYSLDYIVCSCRYVSLGEIVYSIEQNGAEDIKGITKFTDAGSMCGCCISKEKDYEDSKKLYISQIIKKIKGKNGQKKDNHSDKS
jgi:NAD(P)H-nitrite reductase large subunit